KHLQIRRMRIALRAVPEPKAMERTLKRLVLCASIILWVLAFVFSTQAQEPHWRNLELERQIDQLFAQLPPVKKHLGNLTEAQVAERLTQEQNYRRLNQEKKEGKWTAALVEESTLAIESRFETIQGLLNFAQEKQALVDVWAYPEPGKKPRRIPATEMPELKKQTAEQPTFLTLTYRGAEGKPISHRIEFSYLAAESALATQLGYQKHREIQTTARQVLSSRDESGKINAKVQWEALMEAVLKGRLPLKEVPQEPRNAQDVFVAFEFEVNDQNQIVRALRIYRESEVERRVVQENKDDYVQVLVLKKPGIEREVRGFRTKNLTDELEPLTNPVPGQDAVDLRVRDKSEPQPRKWNLVEFGEPELIRETALAKFSLLNAHIEKKRKEIAIRKANLDLIAETVFAGLNIGGGLALVPFPLGEAARLGYNTAVTPWFIPDVPTVKEMRELFQILAAKDKDPDLRTKPAKYLDKEDIRKLEQSAKQLTDQEVRDYLERTTEEDIRAMLRLPKFQQIDARVSNLLGIMADAGRVSGWTDGGGFQKDVFNSIYFSVTGEISIKNIIAVLSGGSVATPLSGASLHDLSQGRGPGAAWLQFFNFTVDVRAVLNTFSRISRSSLAGKELKKPFPYAPRMTDLAAYEIRLFGFPLLIFHKRGLMKDDYAAYTNDFAYGLMGTRIVEHFPTKEAMDAEIQARTMVPLGYVRVFDGKGGWKNSNLAVFAHKVRTGKYKGKTTVIIYGLKAYRENSDLIEREYRRFQQYEQALQDGGVIEQVISGGANGTAAGGEPQVNLGPKAMDERFSSLLGTLLEWRRLKIRAELGLAEEEQAKASLTKYLEEHEVDLSEPLVGVDRYNSTFIYHRTIKGQPQTVRVTVIPSVKDIQREVAKAERGVQIERKRLAAIGPNGAGAVLVHEAISKPGGWEVGPLLQDKSGEMVGLKVGAASMRDALERVQKLPSMERARMEYNHFASMLMDWDGKQVFVTFDFPLSREIRQEALNPISGEREARIYRDGRLWRIITNRRITQIERDEQEDELRSSTFRNNGTLENSIPGPLLGKTATVELWKRDPREAGVQSEELTTLRLCASYVTGQIQSEAYGYHPLPLLVADPLLITSNRYDSLGRFAEARSWSNISGEIERPGKILKAKAGQKIFLVTVADAPKTVGRLKIVRKDLLKGLSRNRVLELASAGRMVEESWTDDATLGFALETVSQVGYRDDFYEGEIPARTVVASSRNGVILSSSKILRYDPLSQKLQGFTTDYTGNTITQVWQHGFENPVEIETAQSRTVIRPDANELAYTSVTTARGSAEVLKEGSGTYDPQQKRWHADSTVYYQAGVTNRVERETFSGFGKLLSSHLVNAFESRMEYDEDGRLSGIRTYYSKDGGRAYDVLQTAESALEWLNGARKAKVEKFVDGKPYVTCIQFRDKFGRVTTNQWRSDRLSRSTVYTYDGNSERITSAEVYQNGALRHRSKALEVAKAADGFYQLRNVTVPVWGLCSTQTFTLGDPFSRSVVTTYENGEEQRTIDWHEGTSNAKTVEVRDRHGRLKERSTRTLNAGTWRGVQYDRVTRFAVSPWGTAVLTEMDGLWVDTDVKLFSDAAGMRTTFEPSKSFDNPVLTSDLSARTGVRLTETDETNVVRIYRTTLRTNLFQVDQIDLTGLFSQQISRKLLSRSGSILEELIGRISAAGQNGLEPARLFAAEPEFYKSVSYRYERGWLVEHAEKDGRQLAFQTSPPVRTGPSFPCNDSPWPDLPTTVVTSQTTSDSPVDSSLLRRFVSHRLHSPRFLEKNPYMPGRTGVWITWKATSLNYNREVQYDEDLVFDAAGRLSVVKANKKSQISGVATKIRYVIPPFNVIELRLSEAETASLEIKSDCSGSDWIYLRAGSLESSTPVLKLTDEQGHVAEVKNGPADLVHGIVRWWPLEENLSRWIPNKYNPQQEIEISAPLAMKDEGLLAVSVHDLARAGLNIHRLKTAQIFAAGPFQHSQIFYLERQGPFVELPGKVDPDLVVEKHTSGLRTVQVGELQGSEQDQEKGRGSFSAVDWHGVPVAAAQAKSLNGAFAPIILKDFSDGESARMLYAISPNEGHFLEHYKTVRLGDAQIYTVVQGFDLPKMEVYRGSYLEDESAPSILSFGRNYALTLDAIRAGNQLERFFGMLHGRVVANGFNYGGKELFRLADHRPERASHYEYDALQAAERQAIDIHALPTLAEALLSAQPLPWSGQTLNAGIPEDWKAQKFLLSRLHLAYPTGLIPTSLGTVAERYVETVAEADIVLLALKLGDTGVAREVLEFYWEKSQGGRQPLHKSYDAQAGTAMALDVRYHRPVHAQRTAEAQLAVAEASFATGFKISDEKLILLGKNLLDLTLEQFRPPENSKQLARGITEDLYQPVRRTLGTTFWPETEKYTLRSNARAYLLLNRLSEIAPKYLKKRAWLSLVQPRLTEQKTWLQTQILPEAERTGIVPQGVFALQDINAETTSLVRERSTSTEDWLCFLEAADAMGVPKATTRKWLENLASTHGVRVGSAWGLDWQIPLVRADVISPRLTAHFARVAGLLGHADAERYAEQKLKEVRTTNGFPAAITAKDATSPLRVTGKITLFPLTNFDAWPMGFGAQKDLIEKARPGWELNRIIPNLQYKEPEQVIEEERSDLTIFMVLGALFYVLVFACALFWWRFRAFRKTEAPSGVTEELVPEEVMHMAEERWARRVLGITQPAGSEKTRFSNTPVEQNFLMQLRAIYKLILEWRRQENQWSEDDDRLAEGATDGWLNGMDEFVTVFGLYMRQVIKLGAKDGFEKDNFWKENEDSNHIWSRLVMYFSEYYWAVVTLSRNYQNQVLPEAKASVSMELAQLLSRMGIRQRTESFDARELFNYPANPRAMDLLVVQKPGATLEATMETAATKLNIPFEHIERILKRYQEFKRREKPYPIHPYTIEFAKLLPHFLLMGLGALVWYNERIGDSPIVPYLWSLLTQFALLPSSLLWAGPIITGVLLEIVANFVRVYRFEAPMLERKKAQLFLDATVTSFFGKKHSVLPKAREGKWWNPSLYRWASWCLRGTGCLLLGIKLLQLETPSFATFLVVKGLLAMVALAEVATIFLPILTTAFSKGLQDFVSAHPKAPKAVHFINRLNITATEPASPIWLSFKYYTQPSVPTGSWWSMSQAIVFFCVLSGVFFAVGGYLTQQILSLWFTDTYLNANNWKLFLGGLLFWNTMYLLRYGLFLMFTGGASFFSNFPLKGVVGTAAAVYIVLEYLHPSWNDQAFGSQKIQVLFLATGLAAILFEKQIIDTIRNLFRRSSRADRTKPLPSQAVQNDSPLEQRTLGVVYMSGDDLSSRK
ncbi:MAG: hypothetical protein JWM16_796, partial [Verrucomicrobiales bacterium]|nr:hypothetical protein [Verrucomicrobiales bacterium]